MTTINQTTAMNIFQHYIHACTQMCATHTHIYNSSYHVLCILTVLQLNTIILYTYPVIIFSQFIGQLSVESKKETNQNIRNCYHYAETVRIYNTV
jgi:hypothetical protein